MSCENCLRLEADLKAAQKMGVDLTKRVIILGNDGHHKDRLLLAEREKGAALREAFSKHHAEYCADVCDTEADLADRPDAHTNGCKDMAKALAAQEGGTK